jgi:hypothetical protein
MVDPIELNDALERLQAFLDGADLDGAVAYLRALHPADSAELIAEIGAGTAGRGDRAPASARTGRSLRAA